MRDPIRSYVEAVDAGAPGFDTDEDRERVARFREAVAGIDRAFTETLTAIQDPCERARVGHQLLGKNYANWAQRQASDG